MLEIRCSICGQELTHPGGLAFGPVQIDNLGVRRRQKLHCCTNCLNERILSQVRAAAAVCQFCNQDPPENSAMIMLPPEPNDQGREAVIELLVCPTCFEQKILPLLPNPRRIYER